MSKIFIEVSLEGPQESRKRSAARAIDRGNALTGGIKTATIVRVPVRTVKPGREGCRMVLGD
jgi:hypothetical protein